MLSWGSLRKSVVALSSAESEWYAAVEAAKEALYVQKIFIDLGIKAISPLKLLCDNQSTIKQSIMAVNQRSSRHIGMKAHFLRHLCHAGKIAMEYISTREQIADLLTKCIPKPTHEKKENRIQRRKSRRFVEERDENSLPKRKQGLSYRE